MEKQAVGTNTKVSIKNRQEEGVCWIGREIFSFSKQHT